MKTENRVKREIKLLPHLFVLLLTVGGVFSFVNAQNGTIRGRVYNAINNEPLEFATVVVEGTSMGAYTDSVGGFEINKIPPGLYNVKVAYTGFNVKTITEQEVMNAKPVILEIAMEQSSETMDTVKITASPYRKTAESPVSLRNIGVNEIARNPGGNRDISRVIQSLPGVSGTVAFRNDIIIRGGSPGENRFYLDGIEVPNINHFGTQGASGGPVGLINVNFIREVDFYTGAFPANRGNALSSVMDIKQKNGRDDRLGFNMTVGSSDIGATLEGPLGKKTTFLASARRSYLQLLFTQLGLPFLPTYNDFQVKTKTKFNQKNELTFIGLGAVDQFTLNLEADSTREQQYILANLPVNTQWNYTVGWNFKHFFERSFLTLVASRSMLNNEYVKYENNDESSEANKILDYKSQEMENKFRVEHNVRLGDFKLIYGTNYEYARYLNSTFNRLSTPAGLDTIDFSSAIDLHKYGVFGTVSRSLVDDRLTLALGVRMDGTNFTSETANLFRQFSPRFSAAYNLTPKVSLNFNTGIYYQLPPYTVLGYRDAAGTLVNQDNNIGYIRSSHLVGGIEYNTEFNTKFSAEGFYKLYDNYPFLLRDSVSLANLGGDFTAIGSEPATPESEGRAYGLELLAQQKLYKGFFGILAYTFVRSEFTDASGNYAPSAWDNVHIITSTFGKKFGKNWEIGARWRFYGGTPFTPIDEDRSSLVQVWDITGRGLPNFDQVNSLRLSNTHNLDVRIDKKWFFEKWSLNLYLDIQNIYNFESQGAPFLDVIRDDEGTALLDPNDPSRYQVEQVNNVVGSVLPTIGVVIDL